MSEVRSGCVRHLNEGFGCKSCFNKVVDFVEAWGKRQAAITTVHASNEQMNGSAEELPVCLSSASNSNETIDCTKPGHAFHADAAVDADFGSDSHGRRPQMLARSTLFYSPRKRRLVRSEAAAAAVEAAQVRVDALFSSSKKPFKDRKQAIRVACTDLSELKRAEREASEHAATPCTLADVLEEDWLALIDRFAGIESHLEDDLCKRAFQDACTDRSEWLLDLLDKVTRAKAEMWKRIHAHYPPAPRLSELRDYEHNFDQYFDASNWKKMSRGYWLRMTLEDFQRPQPSTACCSLEG